MLRRCSQRSPGANPGVRLCPWFLHPGFVLLLELTVMAVFAFGPTCCMVEGTKHVLI